MANQNVIWVTGANGFVGSHACAALEKEGYTVVKTDAELSVCEPEKLELFAREVMPEFIVNCAGVPREATGLSNRIKAYEVNALGAKNMAVVANTFGATIVQVSSDDVYSLKQQETVNEFDAPHPDTPYGKSKRAGEMMVRDTTPDHIIIRSSWVYAANFGRLGQVMEAAKKGEKIGQRTDQVAAPTSINLYTKFLVKAIQRNEKGTFHISTKGSASRYEFAARALSLLGYNPDDILVRETDPKSAENLVLESLMVEILGAKLPTWEEDLEQYFRDEGLIK